MRAALNAIYTGAGYLAALCMIGTLAMVMLAVAGRLLAFHVPGTDAYAGYFMAGAGFLALAHTLKHGAHIRVSLILDRLDGAARRWLELWALFAGTALAGAFAYFSVRLVMQSLEFNDVSTGNDATPLWIPQLAMAIGTLVFALALADEFTLELVGQRRSTAPTEALHNE